MHKAQKDLIAYAKSKGCTVVEGERNTKLYYGGAIVLVMNCNKHDEPNPHEMARGRKLIDAATTNLKG